MKEPKKKKALPKKAAEKAYQAAKPPVKERERKSRRAPLHVSEMALAHSRVGSAPEYDSNPFALAKHPPGVVPAGTPTMAQDDAMGSALAWAQLSMGGLASDGQVFLGYPELALFAQRPEYRRISETIALEMTRKWIKIQSAGDEDKTEKIAHIEAVMKRLNVQDVFKKAAEQDGLFGRGHIYLSFGISDDDREELKTDIGNGSNETSRQKVGQGSLRRMKAIEAVWCYPTNYNANDPLRTDWYKPSGWLVQGKEVHSSRLLTFIAREVPDLLKPAYSFGGLSMSQMAKPYVDNWVRTRQSVSDIINAYSVFVLKTNLAESVAMDGDQLMKRADLFNNMRNNRGLWMLDMEGEDFANVSAPLSGLDKLQAQSQEHMAAVSGIPLVILTGITPSGLNASSKEEIDYFNTWINALQESLFTPNLKKVLNFIQLSEFGEVDPDITFEYEPLGAIDEVEQANIRKIDADAGAVLIASGAISRIEERQRIAADENTPYASLDVGDVPALTPGAQAEVDMKNGALIIEAQGAALIDNAIALRGLQQLPLFRGLISEEDIVEAELAPPMPDMSGMMIPGALGQPGAPGAPQPGQPGAAPAVPPKAPGQPGGGMPSIKQMNSGFGGAKKQP